MSQKYSVTGMTCSACSASVEKAVRKVEHVTNVNVNLLSNTMQVEFEDDLVDNQRVISAVQSAGYDAMLYTKGATSTKDVNPVVEELKEMKFRVIVSFAFMIPLMYIAMGDMVGLPIPSILLGHENAVSFAFLQLLMTLPIVYVNRKYFIVGFKTLFRGSPNMDSLRTP